MKKLLLATLAFACISAHADMFKPSPSCSKPYKPYQFTSEWQVSSFKQEVEAYGKCIDRFVTEQRDEAKTHADAANDAIREYNSFVRNLR